MLELQDSAVSITRVEEELVEDGQGDHDHVEDAHVRLDTADLLAGDEGACAPEAGDELLV